MITLALGISLWLLEAHGSGIGGMFFTAIVFDFFVLTLWVMK